VKSVFIDCETTGTDPQKHGLIQIAGTLYDDRKLSETVKNRMQPFEKETVDQEALDVKKDTVTQIETYQPAMAGYKEFTGMLGKHIDKFDRKDKAHFVGYNADFDADMIRAWFLKAGDPYFGSWFFWPILDVSKLAGIRLMQERHLLPNFQLMTVAEHMGLVTLAEINAQAHDAMFDVKTTMKIFKVLTKDLALFEFEAAQ